MAMLALVGCSAPADLVLTGGTVWTGTGVGATAVAVRGGTIVAVGDDDAIEGFVGPGTERVALGGRMVVPGLMDNHTHFISGGFDLAGVQLRDAATPAEFTRRIAEQAQRRQGEWIQGGTWDHELWGGELPHRRWIDSATGATPVFVSRLDGHMGLANGRALELAGVTARTPDPAGGTIVRDRDGTPTGVLKDAAMSLVFNVIPEPSPAELDRALDAAARYAVARGVTHVTDMGSWAGLETYRRAAAAGRLPVRVYAAVPIATWERLAGYIARNGRGDHRLAWGAVKGFVDGSLGSTTAWFYQPYDDAPETTGLQVTDTTALREQILAADSAGLHVVVHAIGDRANENVLDLMESLIRSGADPSLLRVEHASVLAEADITRFGSLGITASVQPAFIASETGWLEKRLGRDRLTRTYPFRSLAEAGAPLAGGSDSPVEPPHPLWGMATARDRCGLVPEESLDGAAALAMFTSGAAAAIGRTGVLEPGAEANLTIVSVDPVEATPGDLRQAEVVATWVGGHPVEIPKEITTWKG